MERKQVIVPVSGGKDSQVCLKLATERYGASGVLGLFCDTGFEHPKTYAHVERLRKMYGVHIAVAKGGTVPDLVRQWKRFPTFASRFCTSELKIEISKRFYRKFTVYQKSGFEVWLGVRSGESAQRGARYAGKVSDEVYAPHEVMPSVFPQRLGKMGIRMRLPIIDWSVEQVMDELGGEHNPLYDEGFERVGCFPCLASSDKWKQKAFTHDEFGQKQWAVVQQLEEEIGKSVWGDYERTCVNDDPGCSLCAI